MPLISLHDIVLSFGGLPVLENLSLQIEPGERVCLIGRNGEGKSSLLRVIAGEIMPDAGNIIRQQGLQVAMLGQEVRQDFSGTIFEVTAGGLHELQDLLCRFHDLSSRLEVMEGEDNVLLKEFEVVYQQLEDRDGWQVGQRVETVLSRLRLDADLLYQDLSGGMKRRVLLARALVCQPNLLLLDEPTNHLDIDSLDWLEDFLLTSAMTLLFVTHDRMLLKKLASRILDLDRGELTSWPGDYTNYLRRKDEQLHAQAQQQNRFNKKLAVEEIWIRQGVKARRTRNEGRVKELLQMREQVKARRSRTGLASIRIQEAVTSGKLVADLKNVSFSYGGRQIITDFSTTILRGDKIGIIGPNGSGKTTLLRLILGELQPDKGEIRLGTNLQAVYFDQLRAQLVENKTVVENVGDGKELLTIQGKQRHVIGYLQDFLFSPERARSPVSILSGGERNRLLLAKLFTRPANILILDEPTNDLDIETLELLEELLFDFAGTVLLVSHDRTFLNNVVTSTLAFEGGGGVGEYAGGFDDLLRQRSSPGKPAAVVATGAGDSKPMPKPKVAGQRKRTFKENKELEGLPAKIEALEAEQRRLYDAAADPTFYQQDRTVINRATAKLEELGKELDRSYRRWEELEGVVENG